MSSLTWQQKKFKKKLEQFDDGNRMLQKRLERQVKKKNLEIQKHKQSMQTCIRQRDMMMAKHYATLTSKAIKQKTTLEIQIVDAQTLSQNMENHMNRLMTISLSHKFAKDIKSLSKGIKSEEMLKMARELEDDLIKMGVAEDSLESIQTDVGLDTESAYTDADANDILENQMRQMGMKVPKNKKDKLSKSDEKLLSRELGFYGEDESEEESEDEDDIKFSARFKQFQIPKS